MTTDDLIARLEAEIRARESALKELRHLKTLEDGFVLALIWPTTAQEGSAGHNRAGKVYKMSLASRKKMAAAMKRRWREARRQGKILGGRR